MGETEAPVEEIGGGTEGMVDGRERMTYEVESRGGEEGKLDMWSVGKKEGSDTNSVIK